jgi:hypothetical protein
MRRSSTDSALQDHLPMSSPLTGADKGRYRSLPPWRGKVRMGGKNRHDFIPALTPTLALPHRGGGERLVAFPGDIPTPVSLTGEGGGEG